MSNKITIPYKFTPRDYQIPLFNAVSDGYKRGVAIWHRRAGKDKTLINFLAKEAFKRVGTYFYLFPIYKQGRKAIWLGMDRGGFRYMDHIPIELRKRTNDTEMFVELINGSIIQLIGTDKIDSIMGSNPIGCVFSEYALQNPSAWDFIRPILKENGGWAFFNTTPRGRNHAHKLFIMAQNNPKWFCELLTYKNTGVFTDKDIDEERAEGMDESLIEQEYLCSFEAAAVGAYFGKQLREAREQGRITKVPHHKGIKVDTWWDLGMDDSTSIWFTQDVGREIHVIDYFEDSDEGLPYYARILEEKAKKNDWLYGRHTAPHDIVVRELGSGKSRRATAKSLGLNFKVAPKVGKKEDSIEAARNILSICYFDEVNCAIGLDHLASYRKKWDADTQVYSLKPLHDAASHAADAYQTLAISHKFQSVGAHIRKEREQTRSNPIISAYPW